MIQKLSSHYTGSGVKIIIAFDGKGSNRHHKNIDVKFSYTDVGHQFENADQLIKHLIEKAKNPKLFKIVTNDNEIKFFAKECGCKTQSLDSFWGELRDKRAQRINAHRESKEKPDHVTKGEVQFFLEAFNKKKN
jgi:predicted RNA-binding protein with PIN domain